MPEFPIFSPTFLLELIFGVPLGIKFAISFSVAVTGIGMLILARRLGRSVEAGLIAALAVAFGTVSLLEITEGHVNVLAAMWIPWILWSWHRMVVDNKKPTLCGIFLALTFLGGGIYLLMYTALAFIGLLLFARNRHVTPVGPRLLAPRKHQHFAAGKHLSAFQKKIDGEKVNHHRRNFWKNAQNSGD